MSTSDQPTFGSIQETIENLYFSNNSGAMSPAISHVVCMDEKICNKATISSRTWIDLEIQERSNLPKPLCIDNRILPDDMDKFFTTSQMLLDQLLFSQYNKVLLSCEDGRSKTLVVLIAYCCGRSGNRPSLSREVMSHFAEKFEPMNSLPEEWYDKIDDWVSRDVAGLTEMEETNRQLPNQTQIEIRLREPIAQAIQGLAPPTTMVNTRLQMPGHLRTGMQTQCPRTTACQSEIRIIEFARQGITIQHVEDSADFEEQNEFQMPHVV